MANASEKKRDMKIIHTVIGFIIMVVFRFLPSSLLPEVTDVGMNVLGVFLGTLYMWITTETLVPSLIALVMTVLSGYAPVGGVLTAYLNTTLVQAVFVMVMAGALVSQNVTEYIARFFLTAKINRGRPWAFAAMVCLGSFFMAVFVDWLAPIFLFWPILYSIFKEVGYEKGEAFPSLLVFYVILGDILGYHVFPFMRNQLALINNYKALTAELPGGPVVVPDSGYMISMLILSLIIIAIVLLFSKVVFRPDTTKFKNYDVDFLKANPLPKMNKRQKIISTMFIIMIAFLMFPALLSNVIPFMKTIAGYSQIVAAAAVTLLCIIKVDGEPAINFNKIMKENIPWPMLAMIATAFMLGSALTNEATGVTAFLNHVLSPLFSNMSVTMFSIVLIVIATILTNFCNSFVMAILLSPIIVSYCSVTGTYAAPLVVFLIIATQTTAYATPAASPYAATLYGNTEGIYPNQIYKYTIPLVILQLIVICAIGIPLVNLFV